MSKSAAQIHPLVRDLYKRLIRAGKDYPEGISHFREKVKEKFRRNDYLTEFEMLKAVAYGRYMTREVLAINKLHKYRTLNKRYGKG